MGNRMWSRDKLTALAEKRRQQQQALPEAEEAVLAYARWQGLTAEENVDRGAAVETLNRICDESDPEQWGRLKELVGDVDDHVLKGVMHYALTRSLSQLKDQQRDYEDGPDDAPERDRSRSRGR